MVVCYCATNMFISNYFIAYKILVCFLKFKFNSKFLLNSISFDYCDAHVGRYTYRVKENEIDL